jgi:ornithine decarboxylase
VRYPLRVFTPAPDGRVAEKTGTIVPLRAYGPTCDSLDVLPVPLELPENIAAGDWIEFQRLGAYSCALRTAFNGFYPNTFIEVETA